MENVPPTLMWDECVLTTRFKVAPRASVLSGFFFLITKIYVNTKKSSTVSLQYNPRLECNYDYEADSVQ